MIAVARERKMLSIVKEEMNNMNVPKLRRWSSIYLIFLALSLAAGCDLDESEETEKADFSGHYYVCLGSIERIELDIVASGDSLTFSASGAPLTISGKGIAIGNRMTLEAAIDGLGTFMLSASSKDGGESFSGDCSISGSYRMEATVTGRHAPWATFDLDLGNVPRFASSDAIDLSKISRISRFRSGEGHDYSDDFESCRSMKHYYFPRDGVSYPSVTLYSPVNGTVMGTLEEYETPTVSKGKQVAIRPDGYPAFWIIIFHVNLAAPLNVGDRLSAGQLIGTTAKTSGTVTDVAFWVHTPSGDRLLSFFDCMNDALFSTYHSRGVASRAAPIITKEERDNDPLTCNGEAFEGPGNIPNWVYLN